jgi:hypothetical protein
LAGFSVQQGATLDLDHAAIKGCTREAMLLGFSLSIPGGPGVGHATIAHTEISDYRAVGIQAGGPGTTLTLAHSELRAGEDSDFPGQLGVFVADGVTAIVEHNEISGNLCHVPECGPDFFDEVQAAAILAFDAGSGSIISHNKVSDNDTGITVAGGSGCCSISHNKLTDNRFFGMVLIDGDHTSSHDKISGGNVGIAVVATSVATTGTLDHDKIVDTTTPVQELSCCGFTADAVVSH